MVHTKTYSLWLAANWQMPGQGILTEGEESVRLTSLY